MVEKFNPGQVNFTAVPSLSTAAQQGAVNFLGQVNQTVSQVAATVRKREQEKEAERQQDILAQTKEAANDAVLFTNKSFAAQMSSDFNKAALEIQAANEGDPVAISEALSGFAKGQLEGLGGAINPDDYMTLVKPKIDAIAAKAQKQNNANMKVQSEADVQEAIALKQEELLSLDFSVAQTEKAIEIGVTEYAALVDQLDVPDADKRVAVSKFRKTLARKSIIDVYDDSDDKDAFIADLSQQDLAGFSVEEKADLIKTLTTINTAEKKAVELGEAQAKAASAAAAANLHADLRIAVNDPKATPDQLIKNLKRVEQLRADGTFEPQQAANLIIEINNKLGKSSELAGAQQRLADVLNGNFVGLDPQDKTNVAAVDSYVDQMMASGADAQTVATKVVDISARTGIVPTQVRQMLRVSARSSSPEAVVNAADMFARYEEQAPDVIKDLPEKDIALLSEVSDLMRAGMTAEEAVESAKEYTNPLNSAVIKQREEAVRNDDLLKNSKSIVEDMFDGGFFGSAADMSYPTLGGTPSEAASLDYEEAFKSFYRHKPDEEWAKEQAKKVIKRKWAVTKVGGSKRVMSYAPENYYSIPGIDNEWMTEDFKQSVLSLGNVDPESAFITADPITAREATSNQPPKYRVNYIDDSGMIKPLLDEDGAPLLWAPDRDGIVKKNLDKEMQKAKRRRAVKADTEAQLREALGGVAEDKI